MSDEPEDCDICCEEYTKKNNKIKCQFCPQSACLNCVKRYLLDSNDDPTCMNRECKTIWTKEFMQSIFTKTFLNGEYKKHRQTILIDREKAFLPVSQIELISKKKRVKRKKELTATIKLLKLQLKEAKDEVYLIDRGAEIGEDGRALGATAEEKKEKIFIKKCPVEDCRGFLSSKWRCGLCETKICKKCYEVKTKDHECNEETVETIKEITKHSKPCPGCGMNTHKIEGCPQMFCVDCKTVWDYNTGLKLNTNRIHNPHYFEWQRAGGGLAREIGDAPCGGMPQHYNLDRCWGFVTEYNGKEYDMSRLYQTVGEIREYILPKLNHVVSPDTNKDLRFRYLDNEIDEKRWRSLLTSREKRVDMEMELLQLYQMFCEVIEDIFRRIFDVTPIVPSDDNMMFSITNRGMKRQEKIDISKECIKLTEYVYNQACSISDRYDLKIPMFVIYYGEDRYNKKIMSWKHIKEKSGGNYIREGKGGDWMYNNFTHFYW